MLDYVIPAEDLYLLNHLPPDHPKPIGLEWINRGTDQHLRPSTVEMLLRTLYHRSRSPSVSRLHESAGLRLHFRSEADRQSFAVKFARVRSVAESNCQTGLKQLQLLGDAAEPEPTGQFQKAIKSRPGEMRAGGAALRSARRTRHFGSALP